MRCARNTPEAKAGFDEISLMYGEQVARQVMYLNNGYPVSHTPDGKLSPTFTKILEATGDRKVAIKTRVYTFTEEFRNNYGDWIYERIDTNNVRSFGNIASAEAAGYTMMTDENGRKLPYAVKDGVIAVVPPILRRMYNEEAWKEDGKGPFPVSEKTLPFNSYREFYWWVVSTMNIYSNSDVKPNETNEEYWYRITKDGYEQATRRWKHRNMELNSEGEPIVRVTKDGWVYYGMQKEPGGIKIIHNGTDYYDILYGDDTGAMFPLWHRDEVIAADIRKYGLKVNDEFNSYVWGLEDRFETADWSTGRKHYKLFDSLEAANILNFFDSVKEDNQHAYLEPVQTNFGRGPTKYRVRFVHDIGRAKRVRSLITVSGVHHDLKLYERPQMRTLIKEAKGKSMMEMLDYLYENHRDIFNYRPELMNIYKMMKQNETKFSHVGVDVIDRGPTSEEDIRGDENNVGEAYMEYGTDDRIKLYSRTIQSNPNVEAFVEAFLHEAVHAVTERALVNPQDEADRQFNEEITDLYTKISLRFIKAGKALPYGLRNKKEFVSVLMSNTDFATSLRSVNKTWWDKFIDALAKFLHSIFGIQMYTQEDIYNEVRQDVETFMERQSRFGIDGVELGTSYEVSNAWIYGDPQRIDSVKDKYYNLRTIASAGTRSDVKKAVEEMQKQIHFEEEGHEYYDDENNRYESVNEYKDRRGFGFKEYKNLSAEKKKERNRIALAAANIGTTIHAAIEEMIEGNGALARTEAKTGYKMSRAAKAELKTIIDSKVKYNPKQDVVMSEVRVYDPEKGLAGTIDTLIIHLDGTVTVIDYKTSSKGFENYEKNYGNAASKRKQYQIQVGMYKHMIEKALGRKVSSMKIMLLQPTIDRGVITAINLDNKFNEEGVDKFVNPPHVVYELYGEKPVLFRNNDTVITPEEQLKLDKKFFETEEFSDDELGKFLSRLDEIKKNIYAKYKKRLEIAKKRSTYTYRKNLEDFMTQLDTKLAKGESSIVVLIDMIRYAHETTKSIYNEQKRMLKSGEKIDIRKLARWREYVGAYDVLDELQSFVYKNQDVFKDPAFTNLLNDTIQMKNAIKNLYFEEGKEQLVDFLSEHYDGIRFEYKSRAEEMYRRKLHQLQKEGKTREQIISKIGTLGDFVETELERKAQDIRDETRDLIRKELAVASGDVNSFTRWVDNMLDTPDIIAASAVDAFVKADDLARNAAYKKRNQIVKVLEQLEKSEGKGRMQSLKDFYGFMLEHDDEGNTTQHILMPWKSAFMKELRRITKQLYDNNDPEDAGKLLRQWYEKNMNTDFDALNEALFEYAKTLLSVYDESGKPVLDIAELEVLENEVINGKKTLRKLLTDPNKPISEEAADYLMGWYNSNSKLFSQPKEKWLNPEWDVFMNKLGIKTTDRSFYEQLNDVRKSKDARAVFYTMILDIEQEGSTMLPYSYKLDSRLPGVAKTTVERLKEGQSAVTLAKETFGMSFLRRPEDTQEHGEEIVYTDSDGIPRYFLPVHYTVRMEPENQSYDLAGIYFRFWSAANEYREKSNILPQLELAKEFMRTRKVVDNSAWKTLLSKSELLKRMVDSDDKDIIFKREGQSNIYSMFNDWFEMAIYGRRSTDKSITSFKIFGRELDWAKFVDTINRYTSLNLLSFNLIQGIANVTIGETMEAVDAIAGEYVTAKTLTQATGWYTKKLPGLLGNIGVRNPDDILTVLGEEFDILNETPLQTNFDAMSRAGQKVTDTGTLFFIQHAGEHWMQMRFFIAMLMERKAYDKEGNELEGTLLDYLEVKDGELSLKEPADRRKSKWTQDDIHRFKRQVKGILSRMHGEYGDLGRVALQRNAFGRMAYMFRKFVIPGFRRRWGSSYYSQRMGQIVEGNYRSFGRFMGTFLKDLKGLEFALMSEDWAALSDHEKANIRRTLGEITFLVAAIILSSVMFRLKGDADDEGWERIYATAAYQAYRLRAELLFFTPKLDEAMSILRSPTASMSVLNNLSKVVSNLFNPTAVYQRGPWEGQLKLKKSFIQMIPMYKQFYRVRDISEQINWFRSTPGFQNK